jgi:hypothetical protein
MFPLTNVQIKKPNGGVKNSEFSKTFKPKLFCTYVHIFDNIATYMTWIPRFYRAERFCR